MVLVQHQEIGALRDKILTAFEEGRCIDEKRYAARPIGERILSWLAYNTYRTMMKLLTIGQYD
jgi:cardiolipin synthase